jgi:hypothetical protein
MHRETAHTPRRSRSLVFVLLALALVAVFGISAQQALASPDFAHDGATACSACHDGTPSAATATNAKCITCHTGYANMSASKNCWTCHTPGQNVQPIKAGVPTTCTDTCHLASGANNQHNPHPERGLCTTCHSLTASATSANGSPHHTAQTPPEPFTTTVSLKVAPTSIKLKKTVKATGAVTPAAELAGIKVALKAQIKSGTKWKVAKTASATVSATGTYSWTYKPAKKGSYRVTASIAATVDHKASNSATKTFKVK